MKSIRFMLVAIMAIIGTAVYGQEKTTSFKVYGNCEMCKKRIEKAGNVEGVRKAIWDVDSKMMTVTFDLGKVNDKDIQKRIALVGHDTQSFFATDVTYNKLPECCQYDRKIAANTENEGYQEQSAHQHKH